MCSFAIPSSLVKCYFKSFAHFQKLYCFVFLLLSFENSYIIWRQSFINYMISKYFLTGCSLSFYSLKNIFWEAEVLNFKRTSFWKRKEIFSVLTYPRSQVALSFYISSVSFNLEKIFSLLLFFTSLTYLKNRGLLFL